LEAKNYNKEMSNGSSHHTLKKKFKKILQVIGPGFITGAADDDPSGIATYSQTGAQFGYSQLWATLFSLPFMIVVQEMCGRISLVTGRGLAGVINRYYSKKLLYFVVTLLLIANTINIGADLGAMAASAQLVVGLPFTVLLIVMTVITLSLEIFVSYNVYVRYLKYLTLSLFAYIVFALIVKQDWGHIAYSTLVPSLSASKEYILNIVAFLGTTISPYLFFWQGDEEVEEEIAQGKLVRMGYGTPKINVRDIRKMRLDTVVGMLFSNIVTFFILVTAATTLGAHGIKNVETADQAAQALRPIAGDFTFLLFAIGIIGTGLLAVPVLAGSASYAIAEAFNWKAGLYRKFTQAHGFYGIITIATLVGLMINFIHIPAFKLLYYTAILNGVVAPPLIIIILMISNNTKIMGSRVNNKYTNLLGILIAVVMSAAAVYLLLDLLHFK
jgi:NRAMP (natural resistance-associated macrophage protein)-like metal ion transporter